MAVEIKADIKSEGYLGTGVRVYILDRPCLYLFDDQSAPEWVAE